MSEEAEQAFHQAITGYELLGEPLRKWSTDRKNAADTMGLMWPAIGEARWAAFEDTGRYPGMRKDVAIVLWLLSLKATSELTKDEIRAKAWTPDRAFNNPSAALDEAMRWIEEQPFGDVNTPQFFEAANVSLAIVAGVAASQFSVSTSEDGPDEKKTGTETTSQQDGLV